MGILVAGSEKLRELNGYLGHPHSYCNACRTFLVAAISHKPACALKVQVVRQLKPPSTATSPPGLNAADVKSRASAALLKSICCSMLPWLSYSVTCMARVHG